MVIFAFYVAPGDWRDRGIRAVTGYPETHVEMLTIAKVKQANICISASKRDGNKVRQKVIEWKPGHWTFVAAPALNGADCFKRIAPLIGKPYDTLGALLTVTPLSIGIKDRWFCSELMAYTIGLPKPHRYTPGSFKLALLDMGGVEIKAAGQDNARETPERAGVLDGTTKI